MNLTEVIHHIAEELEKTGFKPAWVTETPSQEELYRYVESHPEIASYSMNATDAEYASILGTEVKNPHVTINAVINDPHGNEDTIPF
jgi:hypothetical protein